MSHPRPAPRRRISRIGVEILEARALLAFSTLDPGFGQAGLVVSVGIEGMDATIESVAVQADGKVVVDGGTGLLAGGEALIVRRLDEDGAPDATFGKAGEVDIPAPAGSDPATSSFYFASHSLLVQPDGKIVVEATYSPPSTPSAPSSITEIIRLEPGGQLDPTFGQGGVATLAADGPTLTALALQGDGKIVAAGAVMTSGTAAPVPAAERLDADGAVDTSFGTGGLFISANPLGAAGSLGSISAVAIDPSTGKIVLGTTSTVAPVTGQAQFFAEVIRLDADGTIDASFGQKGYDSPGSAQTVTALAVRPDGKILVAGNATGIGTITSSAGATLIRLDADGATDPTFAADFAALPTPGLALDSLALQPDGKIVVGGGQPGASFNVSVARLDADGAPDVGFGTRGQETVGLTPPFLPSSNEPASFTPSLAAVAIAPDGKIVVAGDLGEIAFGSYFAVEAFVGRLLPIAVSEPTPGDYTGDGQADPAVYLPAFGLYAVRPPSGGDIVEPFGFAGAGQTIPAPGYYTGDGQADLAIYLPSLAEFVIRPDTGGPDEIIPFGIAGAGQTIPAPGDYDGSGRTEIAAYLPALAEFVYRPADGGADVVVPFGFAGAGQTIPAPGDYDGDGKADIAAYLPSIGALAVRPSSGGADRITYFGFAGAGQTIPAPGDYDGDGKADIAAYLPSIGAFAVRPSSGGADQITYFGFAGAGQTIPAPGDYDGDGKADIAAYLPSLGVFAYRPSGGGADVLEPFGAAGPGATIPTSALPGEVIRAASAAASAPAGSTKDAALVPLTDDLMAIPGASKRKATAAVV